MRDEGDDRMAMKDSGVESGGVRRIGLSARSVKPVGEGLGSGRVRQQRYEAYRCITGNG